jgi:hypothetical protein
LWAVGVTHHEERVVAHHEVGRLVIGQFRSDAVDIRD